MEKIFLSVGCCIMFLFTFTTITGEIIRLSGKNYKEENRWRLRMLVVTNVLIMGMFIGSSIVLSK